MDIQIMLRLLHTLEQLRKHERWTRRQLEAYQAESLRRLQEYAYSHSPFYQKLHKGFTDRPLHELPVLTKPMLMENFDEVVTDRAIRLEEVRAHVANARDSQQYLDRYWVNATSGSSGSPGLFLFDRSEWTTILASFARGHEWAGVRVNLAHRMKMASVASTSPWHMSAQVGATLKSWWMPALRLAASDPLPGIVWRLNDWQPEMLVGYASMARFLAEEQLSGRLCIHPHMIFTSSEVLTDETRRRVDAAWGNQPFNQYGATETADIAAEHEQCRRLHVFEDLVMVEVVDDQYRPVPPGEYGAKLLITTLFSRTQPLIRYELNDSVRLATEPGSCGLPFALIEGIQGREEDTLYLPTVEGEKVAVQPLVFNRILDVLPASGWQVIQEADGGLAVLVSGARDGYADDALVNRLTESLAKQGVRVPRIRVQHAQAIPKNPAGKAPMIKSYRGERSGEI